MTDHAWRDLIVGDRMVVDQQFAARVRQSGLSNQEWSLVMTAVELEIHGEGEQATLVADTSRVRDIVPEMERINQQLGQFGGGQGGRDGAGGGLFGSLLASLGLGSSSMDEERVRQAEQLAADYARELESHLRDNGKWSQVVELT